MSKIKLLFHEEDGISISSPFGPRKNPKTGAPEHHRGVDYATGGRKIPNYAVTDGTVLKIGKDRESGALFVEVKYPSLGYVGAYWHLDSISVRAGQPVTENTVIGITGTTGWSTGIHLHFGWYPIEDIGVKYENRRWTDFEKFVIEDERSVVPMTELITRIDLNDKKYEYRISLDGNKFGEKYDKTTMKYFSDKALEKDGWEKHVVINGSIFYTYEEQTYAEGVEKSRGVNNQDINMDCVRKFNDSMSAGFTYDGKIVFDKQKEIIKNLDTYYGAYTGMFGIMKNGELCEWGKELESSRNNMYSNISGRTILGFDNVNNHIIIISITGTTGKTGARGNELYSICKKHGCTDAMCNDGGGSVFLIKDGETIVGTERAVKNAIIVYRRKKKVVEETTPVEVKEEIKKEDSAAHLKPQINFNIRWKNPIFIVQVALSVLIPVLAYLGLELKDIDSWVKLQDIAIKIISSPYVLGMVVLGIWNAVNDPTVKGLSDSKNALTYKEPKPNAKEDKY